MDRRDTIFGLSTAPGRAGIAVIRVSGPDARSSIKHLTNIVDLTARRARRASILDPRSGEKIDIGLVIWFPGPGSFTGEDVAEFHVHGGLSVTTGVLESLGSIAGLRPGEPGEFTRRAFVSGKMDLTEVEGLADLIDAETAAQRRQALRQLSGSSGRLYDGWRNDLIHVIARLEAYIDFPDEDLPPDLHDSCRATVEGMRNEIALHLDDGRCGERLRDGIVVVILGPPNVGKSSIINILSRKEVAIVAEEAGTTRDIIEVHLDLEGYPVILADTAGIRDAGIGVESEGIRRALNKAGEADLKLIVLDASKEYSESEEIISLIDEKSIVALNKCDLVASEVRCNIPALPASSRIIFVSALTGAGMDDMVGAIASEVSRRLAVAETAVITRSRHRLALKECKEGLDGFLSAELPELAADDLRHAADALGRITGRIHIGEILDSIFSEFCIGK